MARVVVAVAATPAAVVGLGQHGATANRHAVPWQRRAAAAGLLGGARLADWLLLASLGK
jgi:hypothetical protein